MSSFSFDNKCQQCRNKGFDLNNGTICNLTKEKKNLTETCNKFESNGNKKAYTENKFIARPKKVGGGIRFVNYLIDRIVVWVLSVVAMFLYMKSYQVQIGKLESFFLSFIIIYMYYVLFESLSGRTLGKLITGTITVTEEGHRPTFVNILGRSLCRFIPFDALSFLGDDGSGWHDSVSKTKVVYINEFKLEKLNTELLDSDLS